MKKSGSAFFLSNIIFLHVSSRIDRSSSFLLPAVYYSTVILFPCSVVGQVDGFPFVAATDTAAVSRQCLPHLVCRTFREYP